MEEETQLTSKLDERIRTSRSFDNDEMSKKSKTSSAFTSM